MTTRSTGTPLRILIIGFYGRLNAGDDLLQQAMSYVFQEHSLVFSSWTPGVSWMNDCDLVVIGGGSIWPGYAAFQQADALSRRLKVPLMVIGISARKPAEQLLDATLSIAAHSPFFHVRDESTYQLFNTPANVRNGVDLFWWMPWHGRKDLTHVDRPRSVALSLREWTDAPWDPRGIIECLAHHDLAIHPFPLHLGSPVHAPNSDRNDVQFLRDLGIEKVADHFDPSVLFRSDMCLAMRFHAILMATRLGIPVIGLGFHPKIRAFFEENGMPELWAPLDDPQALAQALATLVDDYPRYKVKFASVAARLEHQGQDDLMACRSALATIRPRPSPGIIRRMLRRMVE